jgi:anti-anti-sigma factor
MEWNITDQSAGGGIIIAIRGDFDLYGTPRFFKAARELINPGVQNIHIDCSGVRYLDSSGVGAIIKLLQAAKANNTRMTFSGITGMPRKVLSMSNILPLLKESDGELRQ